MPTASKKRILTIAGSDCSGGAGIQADLEQIYTQGHLASTVITALVSETEHTISKITPTPLAHFRDELQLLQESHLSGTSDYQIDAVKIGLITTCQQVQAITNFLAKVQVPAVIDPVLKATAGDTLLIQDPLEDFLETLTHDLLPKVTLCTPNQNETHTLLHHVKLDTPQALSTQLNTAVLVKSAGYTASHITDHLYHPKEKAPQAFTSEKRANVDLHGSGCRLSTNIACNLVTNSLEASILQAKHTQAQLYQDASPSSAGFL